jgi:hypothetical protein
VVVVSRHQDVLLDLQQGRGTARQWCSKAAVQQSSSTAGQQQSGNRRAGSFSRDSDIKAKGGSLWQMHNSEQGMQAFQSQAANHAMLMLMDRKQLCVVSSKLC